MRSGPFVDCVQRPWLSSSEKAHTLNLTQLMWRALFFQTSKFRPSHCQRRHTELNEAAGWTNTANRIALTTNMAHIMLNYGTRHDWTHIQTGEAALRMARILNAIYREHRGAKFLWEMFVFLLFYFFPLYANPSPAYLMNTYSLSIYWAYAAGQGLCEEPTANERDCESVKRRLGNGGQCDDLSGVSGCCGTYPNLGSTQPNGSKVVPPLPYRHHKCCCIPTLWNSSPRK